MKEPDAGMWEAEMDHKTTRYRVAVVRDWIGTEGSERPPHPYFEWSPWINFKNDDPYFDLRSALEARAAASAKDVVVDMQREALRFQPLRLSGRVEL